MNSTPPTPIVGGCVNIYLRVGGKLTHRKGLVLGLDPASSSGEIPIEAVTVNPDALHHAGSADYHLALERHNAVPYALNADFISGKVGVAYGISASPAPYPEGPNLYAVTPSADDLDAVSEEQKAAEATAPKTARARKTKAAGGEPGDETPKPYIVYVNGTPKTDPLPPGDRIRRESGEEVAVCEVKVGDILENTLEVTAIEPSADGLVINIMLNELANTAA